MIPIDEVLDKCLEPSLEELYKQAEALAGRPVEVVGTKDGKYVVEWFSFGETPPPKAMSELGALVGFIDKLKNKPPLEVPDDDKTPGEV